MDQLDGVLGPFAAAVVAAEAEAESEAEPVVAVAAAIPPLAIVFWKFLQCYQPAMAMHFG